MMVMSQDTRGLFEGCHIRLGSGQSVESCELTGFLQSPADAGPFGTG